MAVALDYNKECGDGQSFKKAASAWWKDCDPEAKYAEFSKATRQVGDDGAEVGPKPFVLAQNEYGEPLISDPDNRPPGMSRTVFFKETIKQFLNGHYGGSLPD